MTTEDDFQAALDASPKDWQTRVVFADWLDDRGDPRAEGYRALGLGRHQTDTSRANGVPEQYHWWDRAFTDTDSLYGDYPAIFRPVSLAADWFGLLDAGRPDKAKKRDFDSRREAEDCAARAFAKLPTARRTELLAPTAEDAP